MKIVPNKKTVKSTITTGPIVEGNSYPLLWIQEGRYVVLVEGIEYSYPLSYFLY